MTKLGGGSFVLSPEMSIHGLETRPGIVMHGAATESSGGSIRETNDQREAMQGAHVIYAKS